MPRPPVNMMMPSIPPPTLVTPTLLPGTPGLMSIGTPSTVANANGAQSTKTTTSEQSKPAPLSFLA